MVHSPIDTVLHMYVVVHHIARPTCRQPHCAQVRSMGIAVNHAVSLVLAHATFCTQSCALLSGEDSVEIIGLYTFMCAFIGSPFVIA